MPVRHALAFYHLTIGRSALLAALAGMAHRLTILVVLVSWRTAHALVCRAPAMAAAPTRTSAVLMADVAPDHDEKVAKALKAMTGFANSYCKNTGTTYCEDLSIPAVRYSLGISSSQAHTHTRPSARCPTLRRRRWCSKGWRSTRRRWAPHYARAGTTRTRRRRPRTASGTVPACPCASGTTATACASLPPRCSCSRHARAATPVLL